MPAVLQQPLIVVIGPTAAGKSDVAVRLALEVDAEVVSADSMQVYRGFDIGTGKISTEEQRGVHHHLLDVANPGELFSAARFVELADEAINGVVAQGRRVVVAGGTGLYVRALLRGLFESPPGDEELREEHRRQAAELGTATLHQHLAEVDPEAAGRINKNDLVRISRALEVFQQTGTPISELQRVHRLAPPRYPAVLLGIAPPREELRQRIERRVQLMMDQGWLDEVRRLVSAGHGETNPMGALGYRQLSAHLRGELDLEEAVRQTVRDTRRFARRQMTWFSAEPDVRWREHGEDVVLGA